MNPDLTNAQKREVFTKAVLGYRDLLARLTEMENLVVTLAGHPDADDKDTAEAALTLAKHRAKARALRTQLQKAAWKYGTFNQRQWLENN